MLLESRRRSLYGKAVERSSTIAAFSSFFSSSLLLEKTARNCTQRHFLPSSASHEVHLPEICLKLEQLIRWGRLVCPRCRYDFWRVNVALPKAPDAPWLSIISVIHCFAPDFVKVNGSFHIALLDKVVSEAVNYRKPPPRNRQYRAQGTTPYVLRCQVPICCWEAQWSCRTAKGSIRNRRLQRVRPLAHSKPFHSNCRSAEKVDMLAA